VVVVSHDRYFLNRVCNGILAFEGDGKVYYSEGNYEYYIEKKKNRVIDVKTSDKKVLKEETREKNNVRKLTFKEKKELESIEENIIKAEENVKRIESIFSSEGFYSKYAENTKELTEELDMAKEKVKSLYERWEYLESVK
jgi:ATP-binding cassette subfamily F protein uup